MSAAMVAMLWSATHWDRWHLQLTAFVALAGWFAVRAFVAFIAPSGERPSSVAATRPALVYETAAFAAMGWMLIRINEAEPMTGPAMQMSPAGTASTTVITVGLTAALALGVAGWARQLQVGLSVATVSGGPRLGGTVLGPTGEAACQIAMAAGMTAALLTLL
jgi:hypothetical protein